MNKLDSALVGIIARRQGSAPEGPAAKRDLVSRDLATARPEDEAPSGFVPRATPDTVHVLVKFTGDVDDLRALGFEPLSHKSHPTEGWHIAAGPMPTDRLVELGDIEHVVKVEASRPMRPELDRSLGEINADDVHNASTPFKGAGVVVGIVDSGVDWAHHSFRKADGKTRILGIWDQTLTAQSGESAPSAFPGIGVEYTQGHIDAALAGTGTVRSTDPDGHGTHVAGIAAGDGSQAGNCSGQFTFVGVAPEAEIIAVVNNGGDSEALGDSVNLVNALDFIWDHPEAAGKAIVINLSQGDNLGAHDGTSLVEQMIDLDLLLHSGHMVVKSAGNEGAALHHAQVTIAAGALRDVPVHVSAGDKFSRFSEIWYDGAGSLRCTVNAPTILGPPPASPSVDPGNSANWTVDTTLDADKRTVVRIDSRTNDPDNNDNSIHLEWDPASKATIPAGEWKLRLANTGTTELTVDLWLERGDNSPVFSRADAQPTRTISIPGTARRVVTVGAYSQSGFLFFNWSGDIADFSSRGPTRDGLIKPDVSAPGVGITSALTGVRTNCCCDCCRDFYVDMQGTSMAAPHVTGVVALMYQKNAGLTATEVRDHLMSTARVPDGLTPSALPNTSFGAGKVDAAAAVAAVPPPGSPRIAGTPTADYATTATPSRAESSSEPSPVSPTTSEEAPPSDVRRLSHPAAALLATLHTQLLGHPGGAEWAADVSRHFSEVRGLVNHNIRVAVTWHRMQGPALVAFLGHHVSGAPPGAVLPGVAAEGLDLRVVAFLDTLEKYGSAELAASVRRRRTQVTALDPVEVFRLLAGVTERAA